MDIVHKKLKCHKPGFCRPIYAARIVQNTEYTRYTCSTFYTNISLRVGCHDFTFVGRRMRHITTAYNIMATGCIRAITFPHHLQTGQLGAIVSLVFVQCPCIYW